MSPSPQPHLPLLSVLWGDRAMGPWVGVKQGSGDTVGRGPARALGARRGGSELMSGNAIGQGFSWQQLDMTTVTGAGA